MNHLNDVTLRECLSLLRGYVEKARVQDHKKETAVLTLNQLQKIIAGTSGRTDVSARTCTGRPILAIS